MGRRKKRQQAAGNDPLGVSDKSKKHFKQETSSRGKKKKSAAAFFRGNGSRPIPAYRVDHTRLITGTDTRWGNVLCHLGPMDVLHWQKSILFESVIVYWFNACTSLCSLCSWEGKEVLWGSQEPPIVHLCNPIFHHILVDFLWTIIM